MPRRSAAIAPIPLPPTQGERKSVAAIAPGAPAATPDITETVGDEPVVEDARRNKGARSFLKAVTSRANNKGNPALADRMEWIVREASIPDPAAVVFADLVKNFVSGGYRKRLHESIGKLRSYKLRLYAEETGKAQKLVGVSHAKVEAWRRVFVERYGLPADPEDASQSFIDNVVEKLVPEDRENITRYIRTRSIFLRLYDDAVNRKTLVGVAKTDPELDKLLRPIAPPGYADIAGAAPGSDGPAPKNKKGARRGGAKPRRKAKQADEGEPSDAVGDAEDVEDEGAKADDTESEDAGLDPKTRAKCARVAALIESNLPWEKWTPSNLTEFYDCFQARYKVAHAATNRQRAENRRLKERFDAIKALGKAAGPSGAKQGWMTAKWAEVQKDKLPDIDAQLDELETTLGKIGEQFVGRDTLLNMLADIIQTFSYNHLAYAKSYLNYALMGMPGTGKTTFAIWLGKVFSNLGILLTNGFEIYNRSDFAAEYLGQTGGKTRRLLFRSLESVVFLDEAYNLGQRDSSGKPDPYGAEAIAAIVDFLSTYRGQIVFIAAGYQADMERDFFGVNPGLNRRFKKLTLAAYNYEALARMYLMRLTERVGNPEDLRRLKNPATWQYIVAAFWGLNSHCERAETDKAPSTCFFPNQAGDMEVLADYTLEYYYKFVRQRPVRGGDFSPCDARNVLRTFLFSVKHADVVVEPPNVKCEPVPELTECGAGQQCLKLVTPNRALLNHIVRKKFDPRSKVPKEKRIRIGESENDLHLSDLDDDDEAVTTNTSRKSSKFMLPPPPAAAMAMARAGGHGHGCGYGYGYGFRRPILLTGGSRGIIGGTPMISPVWRRPPAMVGSQPFRVSSTIRPYRR
jgi:hypothetical protein